MREVQPAPASDSQAEDNDKDKVEVEDKTSAADIILPERSLYVSYKGFPTLEKLTSAVMYGQSEPNFNYRSQFPVLMTPDVIDKME